MEQTHKMNELTNIPVSMIRPCPENPRKKISQEELEELAQSIKAIGLLQPITVRRRAEVLDAELEIFEEYYEIVCGHRRHEAAKLAGLTDIPCIVRDLSDEEAYEIMVTENLQRKDVDPFDEAYAFTALRGRGYDTDTLAAKFGKSRSYIFSRLALTDLIPEFRTKYEEGIVDFSHCLVLARLDSSFQKKLLPRYSNIRDWNSLVGKTVNDLKRAVRDLGYDLSRAHFNTEKCKTCTRNTACGSLFLDMTDSICEDADCFRANEAAAIVENFEAARKRNPDFFICDDGNLPTRQSSDLMEAQIYKILVERGFKFQKADANAYENVSGPGGKYDSSDESILGFSFGWKGFFGPLRKAPEATPYKNDYWLDDYAKNRDSRLEEYKAEIANERLEDISDQDLRVNAHIDLMKAMRVGLMALVQNAYTTTQAFGIKGDMEDDEAYELIANLDMVELAAALAKFAAIELSDSDCPEVRKIFPEQFEGNDAAAHKKFMDSARRCWVNYGEVTDEMIEEDLKQRAGKSAKK